MILRIQHNNGIGIDSIEINCFQNIKGGQQ